MGAITVLFHYYLFFNAHSVTSNMKQINMEQEIYNKEKYYN